MHRCLLPARHGVACIEEEEDVAPRCVRTQRTQQTHAASSATEEGVGGGEHPLEW